MNERLKFKGRLTEKKIEAEKLNLRIVGLRDSVRDLLDPFEDIKELRVEVAAEQMLEMAGLHADYKGLLEEITAIKKALGKD